MIFYSYLHVKDGSYPDGLRPLLLSLSRIWVLFLSTSIKPTLIIADSGLSYTVSFGGIKDKKLKKLLKDVSTTANLTKRKPASLNLLQRRVKQDIPNLLKALRSQGFYGARVTPEIDSKIHPVKVMFRIAAGPPYLLKSADIRISGEMGARDIKIPKIRDFGLILNNPFRAGHALDAEGAIVLWFKKQGFPFPLTSTVTPATISSIRQRVTAPVCR